MADPEPPANVTKIEYEKLKAGDVIALANIGFIPSTDRLMPDAYPEVQHLFEVLKNHPTLRIALEGHVCCVPAPDGFSPGTISWDLSVDRARRVQSLLIEMGIAEARLSYRGYGRTKPIFPDEKTGAQQQANRRVDIRIVSK
ncbi:MAG: OmpA family protein [Sphingobacteriales bacterium]|nr:MAG: OmpA family protein [Sphingobacteriales bacterium]